jgi:AraC-like DNA-binding protein
MRKLEPVPLNQELLLFAYRKTNESHFPGYYHCHQPGEWYLVHSGHGHVVANGRIYNLRPGMLFYFQPYQIHKIHADAGPEQPYIRSIVHFEPHSLERCLSAFPSIQTFFRHLWQRELRDQIFDAAHRMDTLDMLLRQHAHVRAKASFTEKQEYDTLFAAQFLVILRELHMQQTQTNEMPQTRPLGYSEAVMAWLETRFVDEFRLDELANDLHLSKSYVSRVFKQETGGSIKEYITARRMREACILLSSSGLSVERIALHVGFRSFSHFSQAFKRAYGVSPNEYRKKPD